MTQQITAIFQKYNNFSDAYKDAYGFRPSREVVEEFVRLENDAERDAYMEGLYEMINQNIAREEADQAVAIETFEKNLQTLMVQNNQTRQQVIAEMLQDTAAYDLEELEYRCGLPYCYLSRT